MPYISLPYLFAGQQVVRELIQNDFSLKNLQDELQLLLYHTERRKQILEGYTRIRERIGEARASDKVAQLILESIAKK